MRAILVLETSTSAASLALVEDGEIRVEKGFVSDRRHNSLLFEPLTEIIEETGYRAFEAVLVGSGPGSYSGTRVGIAAAQGAALIGGCKAVAVPSLLATAPVCSGARCLAVGDARRGNYWIAEFEDGTEISPPTLTDRIGYDLAVKTAYEAGHEIFCMEPIKGSGVSVQLPTAAGLWTAWKNASSQDRARWTGNPPKPIYMTAPHITPSKKKVFSALK